MNKYGLYSIAIYMLSFMMAPDQINAQEGKDLFRTHCGACHTIGGGRIVGPDLNGITEKFSLEWLFAWTRSSQTMIKSGDKEATSIFEEYNGLLMPDQNLDDAQLTAVYTFIKEQSTAGGIGSQEPVVNASDDAGPEEINKGKNIFEGSQRLVNGGPSCISCHNINYPDLIPGGKLAVDLTSAFSRMGGDAGLQGILGSPPFPAMTQAYKHKPITEKEIIALSAFLNKADRTNAESKYGDPLLYGGVTGLVLLLLLFSLIWRGRKRKTVKYDIYLRQLKSI